MKRMFTAGIVILALVWLLQRVYELMPAQQGWIIFSAMASMAMALGQRGRRTDGGTK